MTAILTPELFARALIAASISLREDPATLGTVDPVRRRKVLAAAVLGLHHAAAQPVKRLAAVLGITQRVVLTYQNKAGMRFYKAAEQAEIAGVEHLKLHPLWSPPTPPPDAVRVDISSTPRSRLRARAKAAEAAWKRTLPLPVRERRAPRGARVESLDNGVQVIRLKPVTESVARHAKQQADKGVPIDDLADLFEVEADSLARAIKALAA